MMDDLENITVQPFETYVSHLRPIAEEMIFVHFGERCDVYEPNCEVCKRWEAFDTLVEPYE